MLQAPVALAVEQMMKVTGQVEVSAKSLVKKVIVGQVPDRGGRVNELRQKRLDEPHGRFNKGGNGRNNNNKGPEQNNKKSDGKGKKEKDAKDKTSEKPRDNNNEGKQKGKQKDEGAVPKLPHGELSKKDESKKRIPSKIDQPTTKEVPTDRLVAAVKTPAQQGNNKAQPGRKKKEKN